MSRKIAPMIPRVALALMLGLGAQTASAQAKPPLSQVAEIDDALLMIAIADEVRNKCDTIEARMFKAWSTINALESRAKRMGYSDEEIEDYVTSKAEKKRMRKRGEAILKARGVALDNDADYCTFGREEIAKGSQIGVLLKER
ncbi:hypothetical protein SAMN05421759_102496 [Roseivivax lentus]|uniref:Uncharacterized protein n=1 Tax=Roseivivax lentus TaxID=633194 RepID=A0A1N7L9D3_9RHOB|nr:DUF5333 domain-containing protein [Roseivivax lentus]SIS70472.1 hypothetical protein SAMN05421759_102496 [Roseivivax lentus]